MDVIEAMDVAAAARGVVVAAKGVEAPAEALSAAAEHQAARAKALAVATERKTAPTGGLGTPAMLLYAWIFYTAQAVASQPACPWRRLASEPT